MGTICEANTVVKCVRSGTHNTFIISREHHQVPLRGNIELHREPSSTLELSRRSLTTLLSHCHQPSSYTTIRSPPRNIAASEHTTVGSALLITTTVRRRTTYLSDARSVAASDARSSQLWRLPMRHVASPLSLVPRTARISHTARLLLRPPRRLRGGHPSGRSLDRTQCVLVEFLTSLERGKQDLQKLLSVVVLRCLSEAPLRNSFRRPLSRPRDSVTADGIARRYPQEVSKPQIGSSGD